MTKASKPRPSVSKQIDPNTPDATLLQAVSPTILSEISEQLRDTILRQCDLITLMKNEENSEQVPTLALCLDSNNTELFALSDRMNDLLEAETAQMA